ncbi:MAG: hypothetical protein AB7D46_09820 [Flavobacteriaceae bacterium]
MKKITFFLMLLLSLNLYSKNYYKAKVFKVNGDVIECYSELPRNNFASKNLLYKTDLNSKETIKIKYDEIESIIVISKDGKSYYFERVASRFIYKTLKGEIKNKAAKKKTWKFMVYHNDAIQVFYEADSYYFNKKNELISKAAGVQTTTIPILFRRQGEEFPTYITEILSGAIEIGKNNAFRKMAAVYFEDDAEFVKRIQDKEFKAKGFIELAHEYGEYKK